MQYIKHERDQARLERTAHKNSFTVMSSREEESMRHKEEEIQQELEELVDDEDAFFQKYREMRMRQWQEQQM
jgi:hypothetical protein